MKVFLMFGDRDFEVEQRLPWNVEDLCADLDLVSLFDAMAAGDSFIRGVVPVAVLSSTTDVDVLAYRQAILADCVRQAATVRAVYQLAVETIEAERKNFHFGNRAATLLRQSVNALAIFADAFGRLRALADEQKTCFESPGFTRFFEMLRSELSDDYLATVEHHLRELKFKHGVLASARLGDGNKGTGYVLRRLPDQRRGRMAKLFSRQPKSYTFRIHPRDEAAGRQLLEMEDRELALAAAAAGRASDHILSFLKLLRAELAFYIGCLNLRDALESRGAATCFPKPAPIDARRHTCAGLYDVCLQLRTTDPVVANDLHADGRGLVFITGANRGGKSTFLRSIGVAQLMMQCGMFVPATSYAANLCSGVYTHYKRQEDASMAAGKFEEELRRMDAIVDHVDDNALMLFNEAFAATNEREGSEVAGQIVSALIEHDNKVFFVTHFYELAHAFYNRNDTTRAFLRADRGTNGERTFYLVAGEPLATGYAEDLYARIFDAADNASLDTSTARGRV